jgi:nucleotide-binding universal stress UspA family protein
VRAVLAYRGGDDSPEALALGAALRRTTGAELVVVAVLPPTSDHPGIARVDLEYRVWLDGVAAQAQERAQALLADGGSPLDFRRVTDASVAGGLLRTAEEVAADVLVAGSARAATQGSLLVGSVTDRLLHSSPVPIMLAPQGYRGDPDARFGRLSCAYAGTERSKEALEAACTLAARYSLGMRVVTFVPRAETMFPPEVGFDAEDLVAAEWAEQSVALHDEAVEFCRRAGFDSVETLVARGHGWAGALSGTEWADDDVLVLGSSRHGHVARVFLGSTATKIIRHSPVPVLVVPHGTSPWAVAGGPA